MTTSKQTTTQTTTREGYALEDLDIAPGVLGVLAEMEAARQDSRSLGPEDRAAYVAAICKSLRLNPLTRPVQFLALQGREVLYLTRGATDQLAARHNLNRETLEGPDFRTMENVKVAYCKVKVTLPSGRYEEATATLKMTSPADDLMKVETKAKRRATLSILGVGVLSEEEAESIPASERADARREQPRPQPAPLALPSDAGPAPSEAAAAQPSAPAPSDLTAEHEAALEEFYARVAEIELPGEATVVWMKHRAALSPIVARERENAWKALCSRVEEVGKMKNAKLWLKKAIAEEDARRAAATDAAARLDDGPDDDPPPNGPRGRRKAAASTAPADATGAPADAANDPQGAAASAWEPFRTSDGVLIRDEAHARAVLRGYPLPRLARSSRLHTPAWGALCDAEAAERAAMPATGRAA